MTIEKVCTNEIIRYSETSSKDHLLKQWFALDGITKKKEKLVVSTTITRAFYQARDVLEYLIINRGYTEF